MVKIGGRPVGPHIYFNGVYYHKPSWWDGRELVVPYERDVGFSGFEIGEVVFDEVQRLYTTVRPENKRRLESQDTTEPWSEARSREAFAKRKLRYTEK